MSFANLGLSEALLKAVSDQQYTEATPIQVQAIPAILAGGDLMASAQTGTGENRWFYPALAAETRRRRTHQ
jgi:ATP-dependent RNA helicase RhlE